MVSNFLTCSEAVPQPSIYAIYLHSSSDSAAASPPVEWYGKLFLTIWLKCTFQSYLRDRWCHGEAKKEGQNYCPEAYVTERSGTRSIGYVLRIEMIVYYTAKD